MGGEFDALRAAATINNHFRNFTTDVAALLGAELFEQLYAIPPDCNPELVNSRILARVDSRLAA